MKLRKSQQAVSKRRATLAKARKPNAKRWGVDHETHHLLEVRVPPPSIIALREELDKLGLSHDPKDKEMYEYVRSGVNFESCIANLAERLDIVLDGLYDAAELCDVLVSALRRKNMYHNQPHLRDERLVNVELVEREDTVTVEEVAGDIGTIASSKDAAPGHADLMVTPENIPDIVDWDEALRLTDRREFLGKNMPICPTCDSQQVQLTRADAKPAHWKCRMCLTRFEHEPVAIVLEGDNAS
jgi:hypothetical protein